MDWKVWSKTDKYYIKQYEEETNARVTILQDVSESMMFGTGAMTKYEYGCTIAAALSYLLLRQQDSVGLVAFDEGVRNQVPTSSKKNHLHSILSAMAVETPKQKTDIFEVLRRTADQRSKKGMIVLISDLLVDRESLFKGLKLLRHRGHDVMIFHVLDDAEIDFDFSGTTKFEGMEEQSDLVCDPKSLRDGYLEAVGKFLEEVSRHCAKNVIDYQLIRTTEHLDAALAHYLNHRIGMQQTVRN